MAPSIQNGKHWHSLGLQDVFVTLDAAAEGLTLEEVAKRLDRYGPNELKERPRVLQLVFNDPLSRIAQQLARFLRS
jgi:hypothetical protein